MEGLDTVTTIRDQITNARRLCARQVSDAEAMLATKVKAASHSIGKRNHAGCAAQVRAAWNTRNEALSRLRLVL